MILPEPPIAALVEAPGSADDRSTATFESLLEPLLDSVYRTALRLTRNAADAKDLVQEAALLACRGFKTFEMGSNFKAWFFRILTNAFYSKYRKTKRQGTEVLNDPVNGLRTGKSLKQLLQDETAEQNRVTTFKGPTQRPYFRVVLRCIPPQRQPKPWVESRLVAGLST